jgi:hypothetical protein
MNALRVLAMALGMAKNMANNLQLQQLDRELRAKQLEATLKQLEARNQYQQAWLELQRQKAETSKELGERNLDLRTQNMQMNWASRMVNLFLRAQSMEQSGRRGMPSVIGNLIVGLTPQLGLEGAIDVAEAFLRDLGQNQTVSPTELLGQLFGAGGPPLTTGQYAVPAAQPTQTPAVGSVPPSPISQLATRQPTLNEYIQNVLGQSLGALASATKGKAAQPVPQQVTPPALPPAPTTTATPTVSGLSGALAGIRENVLRRKEDTIDNITKSLLGGTEEKQRTPPRKVAEYYQAMGETPPTPYDIVRTYVAPSIMSAVSARDISGAIDKINDNYAGLVQKEFRNHMETFTRILNEASKKMMSLTPEEKQNMARAIEQSAIDVYLKTGIYPEAFNSEAFLTLAKMPDNTNVALAQLALRERIAEANLALSKARLGLEKERLDLERMRTLMSLRRQAQGQREPRVTETVSIQEGGGKVRMRAIPATWSQAIGNAVGVSVPTNLTEPTALALVELVNKSGYSIRQEGGILTGSTPRLVNIDGKPVPDMGTVLGKLGKPKNQKEYKEALKRLTPEERRFLDFRSKVLALIEQEIRGGSRGGGSVTRRITVSGPLSQYRGGGLINVPGLTQPPQSGKGGKQQPPRGGKQQPPQGGKQQPPQKGKQQQPPAKGGQAAKPATAPQKAQQPKPAPPQKPTAPPKPAPPQKKPSDAERRLREAAKRAGLL